MNMRVHKQREPLHVLRLTRIAASSSSSYSGSDGLSMLAKLLDAKGVALHRADLAAAAASSIPTGPSGGISGGAGGGSVGSGGGSGSGGSAGSGGALVLPNFTMNLPLLEVLEVENNRLSALPGEIGQLQQLRVLRADNNLLTTVPITLRECTNLRELSLENNRLVRPLLDFRCLADLRVLRLFNNPLEFFPEILPCRHLRLLSLANVRIVSDPDLKIVDVSIVQLEAQQGSYFSASKHCLSDFFALIFRYSSVHHPLLASALARICEDRENRAAIGKDESAIRQIVSMVLADSKHVTDRELGAGGLQALVSHLVKSDVLAPICSLLLSQQPCQTPTPRSLFPFHHPHQVEQACHALSSLAMDDALVTHLVKSDVLAAICSLLLSQQPEILVSVLRVIANLALASDSVAARILNVDSAAILTSLCHHTHMMVRVHDMMVWELHGKRHMPYDPMFVASLSSPTPISTFQGEPAGAGGAVRSAGGAEGRAHTGDGWGGENRLVQEALCARPVGQRGVRILVMDGGGMRGMAMVQMLRQIEGRTGRRVHELFDLVCGTSTGGMLAAELGIKRLTLDQCDDVYRRLGKLVFSNVEAMESASWRDKLDQLYKSSSQNYRVVVHGSKHNAEQFEQLLQEMCTDDDGDLLIDSAVKGGPKVFVVSTLVSVTPATPFVFRNYQYPPGTRETPHPPSDGSPMPTPPPRMRTSGLSALLGTCKMQLWQAIRASSAAPYYFDDFAVGPHRWQDGAIFANNPTIVAVREARLLWPDLPLDCVVSLGCGSAPPKLRGRPGWRVADTGQVLAEAATSVEQADLAFESVMPMLPDVKYYRFNPVDERCGMDLDETDPAEWEKLETATDEYLTAVNRDMAELCKSPKASAPASPLAKVIGTPGEQRRGGSGSSLHAINPYRRHVLLVDSIRPSVARRPWQHSARLCCSAIGGGGSYYNNSSSTVSTHAAAAARLSGIISSISTEGGSTGSLLSHLRRPPKVDEHICEPCDPPSGGTAAATSAAAASTGLYFSTSLQSPFSSRPSSVPGSPRTAGSASAMAAAAAAAAGASASGGASPHFGPATGVAAPAAARVASASGSGAAGMRRPVWTEGGSRRAVALSLSPPAAALMQRLQQAAGVGLVHLALPCDQAGCILTWSSEVMSVAEPSDSATRLLARAIDSIGCSPGLGSVNAAGSTSARLTAGSGSAGPVGVSASGSGGGSARGISGTPSSSGAPVTAAAAAAAAATAGGSAAAAATGAAGGVRGAGPPGAAGGAGGGAGGGGRGGRGAGEKAPASLWELVHVASCFVVDGVLHRFMGCHTQILPGGMEVSTYLFSCTAPAIHLTEADIRWMASSWRDRIIVCTGQQGPPSALIDAFLDTGAKAVIAPPPAGSSSLPGYFAAAAAAGGMSPRVDAVYQGAMGSDLAAAAAGGDLGRMGKREAWLEDVEAWIGREDRVFGLAVEKEQASAKGQSLAAVLAALARGDAGMSRNCTRSIAQQSDSDSKAMADSASGSASAPSSDFYTAAGFRKWVVENKIKAVGSLWASAVGGSILYNFRKPGEKMSVKIIHARLHAQALTLAALLAAGAVEYYEHASGAKVEKVAEQTKLH
ncbi:unnamed protein product [Closterium sp. Yama58-4]|nr:unnamed protein product [Closterium sp. Yama58-4]